MTARHAALLAAPFALLFACGGNPNSLGDPSSDDPASSSGGTSHGDGGTGSSSGSGSGSSSSGGSSSGGSSSSSGGTTTPTFGDQAVTRAESWVTAKMPYCGGPNGGHDVICGGTCTRTGSAANPAWDAYRSDCSGIVSFAWGLPAPGRITTTLAPFDTSVSAVIDASTLAPGDALNNDLHVMLFAKWSNAAKHIATVIEEEDCGLTAQEHDVGFQLNGGDSVTILDTTGRVFHAIRKK